MRYCSLFVAVVVGVAGCAEATDDASEYSSTKGNTKADESEVTSGLLYFYVSPLAPNSQGFGPLALRRANAKPTTLSPTYGAATLPEIRLASDALTTQAALNAVIAIPYAGNENRVVAIIGGRTNSAPWENPRVDVVELYTPSQPVAIVDGPGMTGVAQRDALYQLSLSGNKVTGTLVNERTYPGASSVTYDYSAAMNPSAAMTAVQGGALFTGKNDVVCKKILGLWTKCDPPTGVHVAAYFNAN